MIEENVNTEQENMENGGKILKEKKSMKIFERLNKEGLEEIPERLNKEGLEEILERLNKEVLEEKGKAGKDDADRSGDEPSITPPRLQVRLPDKYNVGGGTLSCRASGAPPDSKKTGILVHTAHESPPSLVPVIDTERQSKELYYFPPQTAISEHLSAERNFTPTYTNPRLEPVSSPLSLCNERKDA